MSNCVICFRVLLQLKSQTRFLSTTPRKLRRRHLKFEKPNVNLQEAKQVKYSREYIEEKIIEYDLSVRRLAVMMGKSPDNFKTDDVKNAINYLFPSDLFDTKSRPKLQHPDLIFPIQLKPQVDEEKRPFSPFFYTGLPQYYHLMHTVYSKVLQLQKENAENLKNEKLPSNQQNELNVSKSTNEPHEPNDTKDPINLEMTKWINKSRLESEFLDSVPISDERYELLIEQLDRLLEEPNAPSVHDFIMKFRETVKMPSALAGIAPIEIDANGREFVVEHGNRKTAQATVKLVANGSGKIYINGTPMQRYFKHFIEREIVIAPLSFLGFVGKFDIDAEVDGGFSGTWCQLHGTKDHWDGKPYTSVAGAIRLAVARGLRAFVDEATTESMRQAGLLTRDPRVRERKKPGQWKARKKFTWKKR